MNIFHKRSSGSFWGGRQEVSLAHPFYPSVKPAWGNRSWGLTSSVGDCNAHGPSIGPVESLGARLQVLHLVDLYAADLLGLLPTMTEGAPAAVIYSPSRKSDAKQWGTFVMAPVFLFRKRFTYLRCSLISGVPIDIGFAARNSGTSREFQGADVMRNIKYLSCDNCGYKSW